MMCRTRRGWAYSTGAETNLAMPVFEPYGRSVQAIDVFNRGEAPFRFEVASDADWVEISASGDEVTTQERVSVAINWNRAPEGRDEATVWITSEDVRIPVTVPTHKFSVPSGSDVFVETDGIVSFAASAAQAVHDGEGVTWQVIPNLGRTGDSISVFPVTADSKVPRTMPTRRKRRTGLRRRDCSASRYGPLIPAWCSSMSLSRGGPCPLPIWGHRRVFRLPSRDSGIGA